MSSKPAARKKPATPASPPEQSPTVAKPETINDLLPDQNNANRHSERGMGLLEDALRSVGAGRSILIDRQGRIIAGNGVVEAAQNAGLQRLRVVQTNGNELVAVQRTDLELDSPMGRQMALGDNLIALRNIDVDAAVVAAQAEEHGIPLEKVGLTEGELAEMLQAADAAAEQEDAGGDAAASEKWMILITCRDEAHQAEMLQRFAAEGLECSALI